MKILVADLGEFTRLSAANESSKDITLTVSAEKSFDGTVVFSHDTPLALESATGLEAKLDYPNQRHGYATWELALRSTGKVEAGRVTLRIITPPTAPLPNTDEDYVRFRHEFDRRPSRFPENKEEFLKWQDSYRNHLWVWLMGEHRPARAAAKPQWEFVEEQDHFGVERMTYQSRPERIVRALLTLPKTPADKPVPLVLALHGHETNWGEAVIEAFRPGHADDFCHYFAERGFAVLQTPTMDHHVQGPNWTSLGEWTWDALAGIDALTGHPRIDFGRIGVVGLSTGALLAQLVGVLDNRMQAVVSAGIFTTRNHLRNRLRIPPHCDCGALKYLYSHVENCDLAALLAPRFLQIQHGKQDHALGPCGDITKIDLKWQTGVMYPREFDTAFTELQRAYRTLKVEDRLSLHLHEQAHTVDNAAAFTWISHALSV